MYTLEQLEAVKQEYLEEIADYKRMIDEDIRLKDLVFVKREVSKRVYEKCGKGKNYNEEYDRDVEIQDSHIQEFTEELEDLGLKLDIINKMIDEIKLNT